MCCLQLKVFHEHAYICYRAVIKDAHYYRLSARYHKSRSVNDPDDPRFSLENLAHVFEELREEAK